MRATVVVNESTSAVTRLRLDQAEGTPFTRACAEIRQTLTLQGVIAVGFSAAAYIAAPDLSEQVPAMLGALGLVNVASLGVLALGDKSDEARTARQKQTYDSLVVQRVLKKIEGEANNVVASRRGRVWVVSEPGSELPRVMDDGGYAAFKRRVMDRGLSLDEVVIDERHVTVRRLIENKLNSGARGIAPLEVYDAKTGMVVDAVRMRHPPATQPRHAPAEEDGPAYATVRI